MYSYTLTQWLLFFYMYCFLGWIWESCYVSVKKREWVNRGFMHGPFLPIYGSGAIMVLLATIPVKEQLGLVFICGMFGATLLEYVTGAIMEALFHVRYWDYSHEPLNINGHICLKASLGWGCFSVLMSYVLHAPIERFVLGMNQIVSKILMLGLTVGIIYDLIQSFNEAMDLKELLMNLSQSNLEIQSIKKRLDVVIGIIDTDASKLKEKLLQSKQALEEKLAVEKKYYEEILRAQIEKSQEEKALLESSIEKMKQRKTLALQALSEKASTYLEQLEAYTKEKSIMSTLESNKLRMELEEVIEKLKKQKEKIFTLKAKSYERSMQLLRRNPNATSRVYGEVLEEMKDLDKETK